MSDDTVRHVLITGATHGLGRVMARRFAELDHSVVGCGRDASAAASLTAELGDGHRVDVVDVTDADGVERWARKLRDEDWVPDLLLNNAGVINRRAPLWELTAEEFGRVIDVNVKGAVHVARAFLPGMIERGRGVVVNFSSGWGTSTSPHVAPYCASKHAIEGLTGALAQELPEGLAAVPLSPGIIHTDMLETAMGEHAATHWKPEQWAEVAVPYLLRLGPADNGRSQRIPGS